MKQDTGLSFRQAVSDSVFHSRGKQRRGRSARAQDSSGRGHRSGPAVGGSAREAFSRAFTDAQQAQAADGAMRFVEPETFTSGLGPYYNAGTQRACGGCHAQPNIGGSSPSASAYPYIGPNPQATIDYNADSATNVIPPFISPDGPVREMRLVYFHKPNGHLNLNAPDGGVHDLFTVTGRTDNTTCSRAAARISRRSSGAGQCHLPHPHSGLWRRADRKYRRSHDSGEPRRPANRRTRSAFPSPAKRTVTEMTEPSRGLAGRRRTNHC